MKIKNSISLLLWVSAMLAIGWFVGDSTKGSVDTWYETLYRAPLTPPNYVFGIAWSILYVMIGIAGWQIWSSGSSSELRWVRSLYFVQLILNWSWTPLFFAYHMIGVALVCLILMVFLVLILEIRLFNSLKKAFFMLLPYLGWLCFALYLNFYIWLYN